MFFCVILVDSGSFSVGFAFIYYPGHKPKKGHDDFKQEILNYEDFDIATFIEVLIKIKNYAQTSMAKSLVSSESEIPITREHMIALVLYTDYTQLSSKFSATFRKSNPFESEDQVKKRNNIYWWWSKRLRKTLHTYGKHKSGGLHGPFYSGISRIMTIPEFSIKLYSPTSTSVQISVAIKFCGSKGMIIEMDNSEGRASYTFGFDCSWISRFKEEDERYGLLTLSFIFFLMVY